MTSAEEMENREHFTREEGIRESRESGLRDGEKLAIAILALPRHAIRFYTAKFKAPQAIKSRAEPLLSARVYEAVMALSHLSEKMNE